MKKEVHFLTKKYDFFENLSQKLRFLIHLLILSGKLQL